MPDRLLHLADDLALPLDAVTQTFAVLAKRGVGKTHTASVFAEELLGAGLHVVILDPLDSWWGLRASADGTQPGLPIVVCGGSHGDVPLTADAGAVLADLVVDERISAILSLRHLSKADQRRVVTAFCERLYARKGEVGQQAPLQVILDEADAFVPQRVYAGQERMVGAIDDLVRRGRSSGLGVTLISQRAAVVNKDVLTQIETLIVLRTVSPQDRKALEAWIEAHDVDDQRQAFMTSLASLAIGTAWVWSPGWLETVQRVRIRPRRTFDSSATPKVGETRIEPQHLADLDLTALRERLAATIARAEQEDPAALRRQIATLERALRDQPTTPAASVVERIEVPVISSQQLARLDELEQTLARSLVPLRAAVDTLHGALSEMTDTLHSARRELRALCDTALAAPHQPAVPTPTVPSGTVRIAGTTPPQLSSGARKVLTVLAQYPQGRTKTQVALMTGYAVSGVGYNTILSALRSRGLIVGSDTLTITPAGLSALGTQIQRLPTGRALLEQWLAKLTKAERAVLTALVEAYPATLSKGTLGQVTGYEPTGGGFNNALSRLRTLELIQGRSELRASPDRVE